MLQMYEHQRDDMLTTTCWRKRNDFCAPHFHSSIELVYTLSGCLSATVDGQIIELTEGQLLLNSSYTIHSYSTERDAETVIVIIPLPFVPTLQRKLAQHAFASHVYEDTDGELRRLLTMMHDHWEDSCEATRKGYSYLLLGLLIDRVGLVEARGSENTGLIKDILIYLQQHYTGDISMQQLARHFGYSKSRFSHLFNEQLGCTLAEYVNSLRCQHASQLLLETNQPVMDIALQVGFECVRTFYRAFKRYYGVTPSQYTRARG